MREATIFGQSIRALVDGRFSVDDLGIDPADVRPTAIGQHGVDVLDRERSERQPVGQDRVGGTQQHDRRGG